MSLPQTDLQSRLACFLTDDWRTASALAFDVRVSSGNPKTGPIGAARALNNLVRLGLAERRERRDGGILAWRRSQIGGTA